MDISRRRAEETNRRKNDGAEGSKYTADAGRKPQINRSSKEKQEVSQTYEHKEGTGEWKQKKNVKRARKMRET